MTVDANNLYGRTMPQEMLNGDFEYVSDDECREIELLFKNADSRIAIFDFGIFNHRVTDEKQKSLIFEVGLKYLPKLFNSNDDYMLAPR